MSVECFAEIVKGNRKSCLCLDYKRCIGHENCSTYKTKEQCELENEKRIERLWSLPGLQREHICNKYNITL